MMTPTESWLLVLTIAGVVVLILALAWLHDWNLRRRLRDGLRERGREVNEARARLRELTGGDDCGCGE